MQNGEYGGRKGDNNFQPAAADRRDGAARTGERAEFIGPTMAAFEQR